MQVTRTDIPDVLILEPKLFGDARGFFLESYNQTPKKGVRTNRLKANPAEVLAALPEDFHAQPVPWCENGFYIDAQARPGKHLTDITLAGQRPSWRY